jgi:hypothetical protein
MMSGIHSTPRPLNRLSISTWSTRQAKRSPMVRVAAIAPSPTIQLSADTHAPMRARYKTFPDAASSEARMPPFHTTYTHWKNSHHKRPRLSSRPTSSASSGWSMRFCRQCVSRRETTSSTLVRSPACRRSRSWASIPPASLPWRLHRILTARTQAFQYSRSTEAGFSKHL